MFEEAVRVLANREDRPVSNGEAVAMLAQQVL